MGLMLQPRVPAYCIERADWIKFLMPKELRVPAIECVKMSTIDGAHYQAIHRSVRGGRPDGYWQCQNGTGQYEGYSTPCYKVQSTETYQWAATKVGI